MSDPQSPTSVSATPAPCARPYEVWGVFTPGSGGRIEGFLVATRTRLPSPVAWIEGKDELALLTAQKIALQKRSPESATDDLRGRPVPPLLMGKAMIPVERDGDEVVIGIFSAPGEGREMVFTLAKNAALRQIAAHLAKRAASNPVEEK